MPLKLHTITPYPAINEQIVAVIHLLEAAFPGRICTHYLTGSALHGDHVPLSDINLMPIFTDQFQPGEADRCATIGHSLTKLTTTPFALDPHSEADLRRHGHTMLKVGAALLHGRDLRDKLPTEEIAAYRRRLIGRLLNALSDLYAAETISHPLSHPAPGDDFFGYAQPAVHGGPDSPAGTRMLIRAVTLAATLRVLLVTGRRPRTTTETLALYRAQISDNWSSWLHDLYQLGKLDLQYRPPTAETDKQQMRRLLQYAPRYFNDILHHGRRFIEPISDPKLTFSKPI